MEKGVPGNPEATERELQRYGTFPLYPTCEGTLNPLSNLSPD